VDAVFAADPDNERQTLEQERAHLVPAREVDAGEPGRQGTVRLPDIAESCDR
jgi:hypothetical protein